MQSEVITDYFPRNVTWTLRYHKAIKYQLRTALFSEVQASSGSERALTLITNILIK